MFILSQSLCRIITCLALLSSLASAHTVITYPGWRGNTLQQTGDLGSEGLGVNINNSLPGHLGYPYGMQWIYPCGGQPISQNRTKWPVSGGALGLQPGWFVGHSSAFFYINLGDGNVPLNYSLNMVPVFQIIGPNNQLYNGSFCLPQIPLPVNYTAVIGANATIQVIETAQHGASLYSCADITFADPKEVPEVNDTNCANTTNISFDLVFSTTSLTSAADRLFGVSLSLLASTSLALFLAWAFLQ